MKYGVSLCPEVGRYPQAREQALAAERLGYDSAWLPEHHLMEGYMPSPLVELAAIGAVTERLTLGTDIAVIPFYNPVRLAEDFATLHDITQGRMVLGAGLGYRPEEFAAYNVPYDRRGAYMTEGLELAMRLLTEEAVTHRGEIWQVEDVTIHPRPRPPIPVWVGGWARPALRRAARLGDAWFPGPTADMATLRSCLADYDDALAEQDSSRDELPIFREVWVADNDADLALGTEPMGQLYRDDYLTWEHQNVDDDGSGGAFDGIARDRFLVGSPEQVAEQVVRYRDELGITHLVARMHFHGSDHAAVLRSMELFAEQVVPMVAASQA